VLSFFFLTRLPTVLVAGSVQEEEGIGIANGVVTVVGEDLVSPGCRRGDRARGYVGDSYL